MKMNYYVDENVYYSRFGGGYVPEILHKCIEDLKNTYLKVLESESFKKEFHRLQ